MRSSIRRSGWFDWFSLFLFCLVVIFKSDCSSQPPNSTSSKNIPIAPKINEPDTRRSASLADVGFVGVIIALENIDVAAEIEGKIDSVVVRLGDYVKKGNRIATLDSKSAGLELAGIVASLQAAQSEYQKSKSKAIDAANRFQRREASAKTLSAEELSNSKVESDIARAEMKTAQARVRQLQAQTESLRQQLQITEVTAPFNGKVTVRYVDSGKYVARGDPIVRLTSSEKWVRFAVPTSHIENILLGSKVRVKMENSSEVPEMLGRVEQIAPEVNPASEMVVVEAFLDLPENFNHTLRIGSVVNVFADPKE
ncbi:MAG: efflux RND transporter periplasmic adaptor subunit [Pseudomonadota bacterium]